MLSIRTYFYLYCLSWERFIKTLQKTLLAVLAGSLMTAGAQAAVTYGNGMTAQPYIGAKIGQYQPDDAKDDAVSYGIYGGAKFTPNWGVEAEYLTTSDETGYEDIDEKIDYEGQVYGLYITYDYAFPNTGGLYAKGRLGVAKNKVDLDYTDKFDSRNNESTSNSDTGIAGGLGLGYNIAPNAAVEVAYEWYPEIEDDSINGITLGANFKF